MSRGSLFFRTFGEPGPAGTLVFLHATGLNASAYAPLLRSLRFHGQVLAPSLRGHGATDLPADPRTLKSWQVFADDVAADLEERDLKGPLILAGHSAGAVTALLLAKRLRPSALLMIEPVVLPDRAVWLARSPLWSILGPRMGIAKRAGARRSHFPSREHVFESYRSKPFFASWDEGALRGYLEEGLRADETGVRLSCEPAWEAAVFSAQAHGFWPHLRAVTAEGVPSTILAAEGRSTFPPGRGPRAEGMGASVSRLGGGHMLPVEHPAAVRDWFHARL